MGIYSNLLLRTLMGYEPRRGAAGNKLVPDLATSVPEADERREDLHVQAQENIKFGPPVNRAGHVARTSKYALQQAREPEERRPVRLLLQLDQGLGRTAPRGRTISGITTPNASTLVIKLTQPTGDFLYADVDAGDGADPAEVTKCFEGKPGQYGRNIVSTGPYMFKG